jgi:hypothetical protein
VEKVKQFIAELEAVQARELDGATVPLDVGAQVFTGGGDTGAQTATPPQQQLHRGGARHGLPHLHPERTAASAAADDPFTAQALVTDGGENVYDDDNFDYVVTRQQAAELQAEMEELRGAAAVSAHAAACIQAQPIAGVPGGVAVPPPSPFGFGVSGGQERGASNL